MTGARTLEKGRVSVATGRDENSRPNLGDALAEMVRNVGIVEAKPA